MSDSEVKSVMGRPRLYTDPELFSDKVDAYFADCEERERKPTLAGLCLSMGFCDKDSFVNYQTYGPDFSRTVTRAKLMMEDDRHQLLLSKDKFTPGVAFDLKNNHGWKDKSETELTGANGGPVETVNWTANADEETLKKVAALKGL